MKPEDSLRTKTISFIVPMPPKELLPNKRIHWAKKDKFRKACINDGFYAAASFVNTFLPTDQVKLSVCFHFIDKRKRDLDNFLAGMKATLDGVCQGLGIDDSQIQQISVSKHDQVCKNPFVLLIMSNEFIKEWTDYVS